MGEDRYLVHSETPSSKSSASRLTATQIWWLSGTALVITGLVVVAFSTPFVGTDARTIIMGGFHKVCHQLPTRSFSINGVQVALCHRCVGIYAALPLAIALFAAVRRWDSLLMRFPVRFISLSLVPMAFDWGGDFLGLWSNTPLSRLATGATFGIVAGYFLAKAVATAATRKHASGEVRVETQATV